MGVKKVIDYYNNCQKDYHILWGTGRNFSMHYGFYDKNHKKHKSALLNMNRVLADLAKVKSGDKILDAGCGIGGSSVWLADNFKADVIGINIQEMQVEMAKNIAKQKNLDNIVKFFIRDFTKTGFQDNFFDVVWAIESLCHTDDKKLFVKEAIRILKNGGRLVIADGFLRKKLLSKKELKIKDKFFDGWAVPNLFSIDDFSHYLKDIGFKNIKFFDATKNVMPSSKRLYFASIFAFPFGKLLQWLGVRSRIQTKNIISAYYQYITLKKKIWAYGIFYAEKFA